MPSPIKLREHLTKEELKERYRECRDGREKIRWLALKLIAAGGVANQVAKEVGMSSGWMTNLARRYNERGAAAVADRERETPPGPKPTLSREQAKALEKALRGPAPDGGLWTAPKVAVWIKEQTGKEVHATTAWRAMKAADFSLQVPRPQHRQTASEEERLAFKKSSAR